MEDRGKTVWFWTTVASLGAYLYWWVGIGLNLIRLAEDASVKLWGFRETREVFEGVREIFFATIIPRVTFVHWWLLSVLIVRIATRTAIPVKRRLVWPIRVPWAILTPLVYLIVRLNHVIRTSWGEELSRSLNWPAWILNIIVFLWMGWTLFAIGSTPREEADNE